MLTKKVSIGCPCLRPPRRESPPAHSPLPPTSQVSAHPASSCVCLVPRNLFVPPNVIWNYASSRPVPSRVAARASTAKCCFVAAKLVGLAFVVREHTFAGIRCGTDLQLVARFVVRAPRSPQRRSAEATTCGRSRPLPGACFVSLSVPLVCSRDNSRCTCCVPRPRQSARGAPCCPFSCCTCTKDPPAMLKLVKFTLKMLTDCED